LQNDPVFLNLDDVLQIHQDTISIEGGSDGVRDIALIDSAVAAPKATYEGEYLHQDLAAMTAALMYALISNHGFVDGNKRVGTLAALIFRDVNGEGSFPPAQELEATALSVARGELSREELTDWWRSFN
jgi:death on curing protein